MELKIEVEEEFDLEKAICNHGLFMTLPNQWNPRTKSLRRPLRLGDGTSSVMVSISSTTTTTSTSTTLPLKLNQKHFILIHVHNHKPLSLSHQRLIQNQVKRMLRLTNKDKDDVRNFQEMHGEAKSKGFGRLFRSPDLFEDVIKTYLLCSVTWVRTLEMCRNLCDLQAELHSESRKLHYYFRNCKRKQDTTSQTQGLKTVSSSSSSSKPLGNFPNSKELAGLTEEFLSSRCKLGYRAKYVIQMAKLVEEGKLKVSELEADDYEMARNKLIKVKGIGPFAAANILMCMGDYTNIPTDTETIHHLRQVHGMKDCCRDTVDKDAKQVYDTFRPYQCLAYWYELVESYEKKLGQKLSELSPSSYYKVAAGSYLSNNITVKKRRKKYARH